VKDYTPVVCIIKAMNDIETFKIQGCYNPIFLYGCGGGVIILTCVDLKLV